MKIFLTNGTPGYDVFYENIRGWNCFYIEMFDGIVLGHNMLVKSDPG